MANGMCIDLWRRREVEQAWLDALAAHPEAVEPSAEDRAIVIETLCRVSAMLERLPEKVASAFVLSQLHGLRYREIAERLQVSERMVKKYMARAMLHCVLLEAGSGS
jgi:RNA polymerase sigma-70 factor (ECF subfamily)